MSNDNPKAEQTSKQPDTRAPRQDDEQPRPTGQSRAANAPATSGPRPGQPANRAAGGQAKGDANGQPPAPRQPRQPATAKPTGPALTRPTTPPGSFDPNRRGPTGPRPGEPDRDGGMPGNRNQPGNRGRNESDNPDEVFHQRVFDPTVSDTVVPAPGGARPAGGRGRTDRDRSFGPPGGGPAAPAAAGVGLAAADAPAAVVINGARRSLPGQLAAMAADARAADVPGVDVRAAVAGPSQVDKAHAEKTRPCASVRPRQPARRPAPRPQSPRS